VTGHAPVLKLCRELLAQGVDPDTALTVYRRGIVALKVRSIGEAARLTVKDDGNTGTPRFVAHRQTRAAAPCMRKNGGAAPCASCHVGNDKLCGMPIPQAAEGAGDDSPRANISPPRESLPTA
jgi:hypothetical protein